MSAEHTEHNPCLNGTGQLCKSTRARVEGQADGLTSLVYSILPCFENSAIRTACEQGNYCPIAKAAERPGFAYHRLRVGEEKDNNQKK